MPNIRTAISCLPSNGLSANTDFTSRSSAMSSTMDQGEGDFLDICNGDYEALLPIPYWSWIDKKVRLLVCCLNIKMTMS